MRRSIMVLCLNYATRPQFRYFENVCDNESNISKRRPSTVVGAEQTKRLRFVSRRRPANDPIGSTGRREAVLKISKLSYMGTVLLIMRFY